MDIPAPHPQSPPKNSPLLIGCLVVLGLFVVAIIGLVFIGWLAQKFETPAQRKADQIAATKEAKAEQDAQARELAASIAKGKAAQERLAKVAAAVATLDDLKAMPCPHPNGAALDFAPVDAEYMRRFRDGIPTDVSGTAWFRYEAFNGLGYDPKNGGSKTESDAAAAGDADRRLAGVGSVAVIHTISLRAPRLVSAGGAFKDGSYEGGSFSGWIQLIDYSTARTVCEQPFSASSSTSVGGGVSIRIRGIPLNHFGPNPTPQQQIDKDFQSNFWKAAQDAVDH